MIKCGIKLGTLSNPGRSRRLVDPRPPRLHQPLIPRDTKRERRWQALANDRVLGDAA